MPCRTGALKETSRAPHPEARGQAHGPFLNREARGSDRRRRRCRLRLAGPEELPHHADDRLHHGVALDEDDTDNVLFVAGHEDSVVAHQYANRGFVGDLPELHRLHDDRVPPIVTNPLGVSAVGVPVEDRHDAIVAQDAFDFAVGHVIPGVGGHWIFTAALSQRQSRVLTVTLYFFDSHAHIQRSRSGREVDVRQLLENARNTGVRAVLAASVDRADWDKLPQIEEIFGVSLYFSLGLHPFFVLEITPATSSDLMEDLKVRVRAAGPRMRAIGECGLDFLRARTTSQREHQLQVFRAQLELARETGLPLTIHCVKAHGPMIDLLRERPTPPSVMHAFSGSAEVARACVAAGHYVSFAGNLLLAKARKVVEAAVAVPDDRLLIETDTPDQTPPARRPADNEPAFIVDIAQRLAELRECSVEAIAAITFANAERVFRL